MIRESLLADFDQEMAVTRRLLERAPGNAFAWKPHEKSFTLGGLATHLAQIPRWGLTILRRDSYDMDEADSGERTPELATVGEVLELFDRHVTEVRQAVTGTAEASFLSPWSLTRGVRTILTMPRFAALRGFILNHTIHHRGQLTVYLRMQDVPLPPVYGPTADERM